MKVVRLSALRTGHLYTPGNIPGTHFCWRLSQPRGHRAAGRIMWMKNSNDTFANRTRDLPACSAVPQPTALPRVERNVAVSNLHISKRFFSAPNRPEWLCDPACLLSCGYHGYLWVQKSWDTKFETHVRLVSRLRVNGTIPLFPLYTFMVWTGTTLPFFVFLPYLDKGRR